jgi:peptide/nickel transport system substrate-binding protein
VLPWTEYVNRGKYGGILPIGDPSSPDQWDLHKSCCNFGPSGARDLYNNLVYYDPLNQVDIIGDLAETWEWAADGLSVTFRIHANARWSDGVSVTAEDVKYSLDRMAMTGVPRPRVKNIVPYYESSEVINPTTVKVNTKFPRPAAFLRFLATDYMVMVPKHVLEAAPDSESAFDNPADIVGSGAFLFVNYEPGSNWEHEKNPNYWKEGLPFLDGRHTFYIKDRNRMQTALETQQILYTIKATGLTEKQTISVAATMEERGIGTVLRSAPSVVGIISMNWTRKPFSDRNVRRAVHLALDSRELVNVHKLGNGWLPTPFFPGEWTSPPEVVATWPGYRYVDEEGNPYLKDPIGVEGLQKDPRDIEEARQLMADAGYADGLKANFHGTAGYKEISVLMREQFKKIGLDLVINFTDSTTRTAAEQSGDYSHFLGLGYGANIMDPDDLFIGIFLPGGPRNSLDYEAPGIRDIFEKQRTETDPVKRKALVAEAEEILRQGYDHSLQYYWVASAAWAVNSRVKNVLPRETVQYGHLTEHIWLEKR